MRKACTGGMDLASPEHNSKVRSAFATLFASSVMLLIYASILPVSYQSINIDIALEQFWKIPWLDIQLYGRADWMANFLVVLPVGWFAAAACDWGRDSQRLLLGVMPLIIGLICVVVIGIEFLQSWFPNRTQSLNDVAAGCLGALLGPLLWLAFGRWTVQTTFDVLKQGLGRQRLYNLALLYAISCIVFSALPFDLVMSWPELQAKVRLGRLEVIPHFDSLQQVLKPVGLSVLRTIPLTLLLCVSKGLQRGMAYSVVFAVMCELVQVPVFSRHASLFDAFTSVLAVLLIGWLHLLQLWSLPIFRRSGFWLSVAILSSLGLLTTFVVTAERVVSDPLELAERLRSALTWPMARYYHQAEFAALTTLVYRLIAFSWIGSCFGCAVVMASADYREIVRLSAFILIALTAVASEFLQVWLPPHFPDAFDSFVALLEMLFASWAIQRLLDFDFRISEK